MGTPAETNTQPTPNNNQHKNTQDEEFRDHRISEHCSGQTRPWRSSPRSSSRCPPSITTSPPRCPPATSNRPPRCSPSTGNCPPHCPSQCGPSPPPCPP